MKRAVALIISDIHAHTWQEFSSGTDERNERVQQIFQSLEWVEKLIDQHQPEDLFVLGDVFHVKGNIRVPVFNPIYSIFSRLSSKVHIMMIPGNHDQWNREGDIHALEIFKNIAQVEDKPCIEWDTGLDYSRCWVPFRRDSKIMEQSIREFADQAGKPAILLTHCVINEVVVGHNEYVLEGSVSIPPEIQKLYAWIISGDIHKRQTHNNIHYPGSLLAHNFSDAGDLRGATILFKDGDDLTIESVDNPFSPFFGIFNLDETDYTLIRDWAKDNPQQIYLDLRGSQAPNVVDTLFQGELPRVRYRYTQLKQEHKAARSTLKLSTGVSDTIAEYVDHTDTTLDKEKLKKKGLELLSAETAGS